MRRSQHTPATDSTAEWTDSRRLRAKNKNLAKAGGGVQHGAEEALGTRGPLVGPLELPTEFAAGFEVLFTSGFTAGAQY